MKKIIVYGSKVFGSVIRDLVTQCGYEFVGFIDDFSIGENILGDFDFITKNYPKEEYEIVIAIGYFDLQARWTVYQKVVKYGYETPSLIHPAAYVRNVDKIGKGCIIMAGAIVEINAEIKDFVVILPGAVVNHDSIIGPNTFLSPNSTICGCVNLGHSCFIGAGAVVVDHNNIPDKSFIKAGSVYYTKD